MAHLASPVYFENSSRLATNRHHRGSGKALKPGLPHYGSMKAFRPAARSNIFMLAWCPLADMQPTSKIAACGPIPAHFIALARTPVRALLCAPHFHACVVSAGGYSVYYFENNPAEPSP
jgi:hypothetical protein